MKQWYALYVFLYSYSVLFPSYHLNGAKWQAYLVLNYFAITCMYVDTKYLSDVRLNSF